MWSFYSLMGVSEKGFDLEESFVSSWLLRPSFLAGVRSSIAMYCFTTQIVSFVWDGTHGEADTIGQSFSYFTHLTWWGLACYFLISGVHTGVYAVKGYSWLHHWPKLLQFLHSLYYSTVITFPFLVTIVYWGILYPSSDGFKTNFELWDNISHHALNAVFAIFEIVVPATNPPPMLHQPWLWVLLLLYLGLAYLTFATQGFYTYSFLDIQKNGSGVVTGYIFGILAATIVIFMVVWLLIWFRRKLTGPAKRSRHDFRGQSSDVETSMVMR